VWNYRFTVRLVSRLSIEMDCAKAGYIIAAHIGDFFIKFDCLAELEQGLNGRLKICSAVDQEIEAFDNEGQEAETIMAGLKFEPEGCVCGAVVDGEGAVGFGSAGGGEMNIAGIKPGLLKQYLQKYLAACRLLTRCDFAASEIGDRSYDCGVSRCE